MQVSVPIGMLKVQDEMRQISSSAAPTHTGLQILNAANFYFIQQFVMRRDKEVTTETHCFSSCL